MPHQSHHYSAATHDIHTIVRPGPVTGTPAALCHRPLSPFTTPTFASTTPSSRPRETAINMNDTTASTPIYVAGLQGSTFAASPANYHRVPLREHRNTMASQRVSLSRLDRHIPDSFGSHQLNHMQPVSGQSASYHVLPHSHLHQTSDQPIDTQVLNHQNTADSLSAHHHHQQQQITLAQSAAYCWNADNINYLIDPATTASAPHPAYAPAPAPPRSLWAEGQSVAIPMRETDPLYSPALSAQAHQSQQPLGAHKHHHQDYDMISSPSVGPYHHQQGPYYHHQGRGVILGSGVGIDLSRQTSLQPYYSIYHEGLSTASMSSSPTGHYASDPSMLSPDDSPAADNHESPIVPRGGIVRSASNNSSSSTGTASKDEEPYAKILFRALMEAPGHAMRLRQIYQWFEENTDKPKSGGQGWQNSIRHNLSMNQAFIRREHGDGSGPGQSKKNAVWALESWAVENGIQSTTRYRVKHLAADPSAGIGSSSGRRLAGINAGRQTSMQQNKAASGRKGGCATNKVKRQRRFQHQFDAHGGYRAYSQSSEYHGGGSCISTLGVSPDQYYAPEGLIPVQASSPMTRESYDAGALLAGNRYSEVKQEEYQVISPPTPPQEYHPPPPTSLHLSGHDSPRSFNYQDVEGVYGGSASLVETEAEFMSASAEGGPKHSKF